MRPLPRQPKQAPDVTKAQSNPMLAHSNAVRYYVP
jgi:hypothetical protein